MLFGTDVMIGRDSDKWLYLLRASFNQLVVLGKTQLGKIFDKIR